MAGKNLKPYQGLKQLSTLEKEKEIVVSAGKNLKPYQGLKQSKSALMKRTN